MTGHCEYGVRQNSGGHRRTGHRYGGVGVATVKVRQDSERR